MGKPELTYNFDPLFKLWRFLSESRIPVLYAFIAIDVPQSPASPLSPAPRVSTPVLVAAVAGNALEFYDFVLYAYFATYIGQTFFPASTPYLSLLLSVAVFGVGFIARPLGAILLGAYADRAGRRPALLLSMSLITLGTLGVALTPSYATIGVAAPLIVVLCRLVQGLALGGDVGSSTAFLVEAAPPGRRGLYTSWQLASQGLSTMAAGALGLCLTSSLTPAQMQEWGWRVPFALGLLLVPIALYLRKRMPETGGQAHKNPLSAESSVAGRPWAVLGLAVLILAGATISTYVSSYMTTYAANTLKLPPTTAMAATVVAGLFLFLGALTGGWLSDRYGVLGPSLVPRLVLAGLITPVFSLLAAQPSLGLLLAAAAFVSGMTTLSGAPALLAIANSLPTRHRASGLALSYALATAVFGRSTQVIATWLIQVTHNPTMPAWYVAASSLAMCAALIALIRRSEASQAPSVPRTSKNPPLTPRRA